ncbi:MAG: MoaD/ThiS family protein [Pseudomonadota bacterium]
MIKVTLPFHLQRLAQIDPDITIDVKTPATQRAVIEALELRYPTLRGAIVDLHTGKRRPLLRFFACQRDISHEGLDTLLPAAVAEGREEFLIVGAISGG